MKVIQITDDDAKALVEELEMLKHRSREFASKELAIQVSDIHRSFHFYVVRWLQKHGANVTS